MSPRILTPSGYRDIADLVVGDEICAFDIATGAPITNAIEGIQYVDAAAWASWWKPMVDRAELPETPAFTFYRINGQWTLNSEQSIWYIRAPAADANVCHAKDLQVGDTLFDDADHAFTIASFDEVTADGWYRFDISGDHSYIVDGLTLHNASRFAVNAGNVAWTWDLTTTTHWSATDGGGVGASPPGPADTVTFNGNSGGNVVTPNYGGTGTFQSIGCGAFTGTIDWSVNNNNCTLSSTGAFSCTGTGARTIKFGSSTFNCTAATAAATLWNFTVTTNLIFDAGTSIIELSGAATGAQSFLGGGLSYATLKISGARLGKTTTITNAGGTLSLNISAACSLSFSNSQTIANWTASAQFTAAAPGGLTLTLTNAPTWNMSQSGPGALVNSTSSVFAINCGSNVTASWISLFGVTLGGGGVFTFNKSYDLGLNSGATITPPKYISRSRGHYLAEAA